MSFQVSPTVVGLVACCVAWMAHTIRHEVRLRALFSGAYLPHVGDEVRTGSGSPWTYTVQAVNYATRSAAIGKPGQEALQVLPFCALTKVE